MHVSIILVTIIFISAVRGIYNFRLNIYKNKFLITQQCTYMIEYDYIIGIKIQENQENREHFGKFFFPEPRKI